MKTLDVQALHKAIDQTLEQLKHQSDEFAKVKKAVDSIASLDDALKGKGGDAIRAFYEECHTPFLQFYDSFIEEYSSTLKKMKSALNSLEPNHNGFISQSFLEHELENGLNAADRTTKNLVSKTNTTIAKVSHIVDLPDLNDNGFHEQNQKAIKEISTTLEKLHAFDREQTNALKTAENDLETMQRYISRLEKMYTGPKIEITGYQKGSILKPDEMDTLRGGQDTAMGVMLDKLDKRSKIEKEASKIEPMSHTDTLKKKLEKLYDDPDEFLKVAREIGYDNLTSEQMNYVTAIEEAYEFRADPIKGTLEDGKHVLESMKGFVVGGYDFAKDTIQGTIETGKALIGHADDFIKNPKATVNSALEYDYRAAFESMLQSIADSWDEKMVHGDSYSRGHYIAYAIGTIWGLAEAGPTVVSGSKSLGKAGKAAAQTAKKSVNSVKQHFSPPKNRYTPALEGMLQRAGEAPNVKNTPLLKELLEDKKKSVLVQAAPYTFKDSSGVTKTISLKMGHLKNKKHPITGVPYDKNGFPIFKHVGEVKIDKKFYKSSDAVQFRQATLLLKEKLEKNPELKKVFTDRQLQQISKGKKPEGYTWHHHQKDGIMQLVDSDIHGKTGHTGGRNIWGGGSQNRK
ncbi:T7SS effector LXG polymorphic toxin [Bacillus paralicheniformis]|uniref:T7SS effector LXG polymorphic toxin n=1 Tax=Bacillus paralicheniformis TaxID=1648923 RepID=UPI001FD65719|nr:T7SS effector LXG polymorphic toxin [Bacillus paralicheniformis]MCJ8221416.1 T7SS effector LXG polymorphic toxin [Bacillus paralicheniformis]